MSDERVIKEFKDISMSFQSNPVNDDLIALRNENSIARAIKNLVLTNQGERPFQNDLGSRVQRLLFENIDQFTASSIETEVKNVILNYEPRVRVIEVNASPDYDNNAIDLKIVYQIIGIDALPQQLNLALQPVR